MHTTAKFYNISKTYEGDTVISFKVADLEGLDKLQNKKLILDAQVFRDKKSNEARKYFWKLCTMIGEALGVGKDVVYLQKLKAYGVHEDIDLNGDNIEMPTRKIRCMDVCYDEVGNKIAARCYLGISSYDSKEMSKLITNTRDDAKDLGLDVWTEEEIAHVCSIWKGEKNEIYF